SRTQRATQGMMWIVGYLARTGFERGHDAAGIDQAEEIRNAEPEARSHAHALPVSLEQIPDEAGDELAHPRPLEAGGQRAEGGGDQMLVPAALSRHFDRRSDRGRPLSHGETEAHALEQVVDTVRRNLSHEPARHSARGGLKVRSAESRARAFQDLSEVDPTD